MALLARAPAASRSSKILNRVSPRLLWGIPPVIAVLLLLLLGQPSSSSSFVSTVSFSPSFSISSLAAQPTRHANKNKWLVYYSVGGENVSYVEMLRFSLTSLRSFRENDNIDVFVLANRRFAKAAARTAPKSVTIIPRELNLTRCKGYTGGPCMAVLSSMRKTEVFDIIPNIEAYKAVLFLDADIAVCGPLEPLLMNVSKEDARLHVKRDEFAPGNLTQAHNMTFWSHQDYTSQEFQLLESHKIRPFNAGQFAFVPTQAMRQHFAGLNAAIEAAIGSTHFYEQSHMNRYFNPRQLTVDSLHHFVSFNTFVKTKVVVHAPNNFLTMDMKLDKLKAAWKEAVAHNPPITIAHRFMLHSTIGASRVVDVGAHDGNFSAYMHATLRPKEMWLLDAWEDPKIETVEDGVSVTRTGLSLYNRLVRLYSDNPNVRIFRDPGCILCDEYSFDARSVDLVYIHGDRMSAQRVKENLEAARRVVEPGSGWLAGDRYTCGNNQTSHFRAVIDEFCAMYGLRIWYEFAGECSGYAIRM